MSEDIELVVLVVLKNDVKSCSIFSLSTNEVVVVDMLC